MDHESEWQQHLAVVVQMENLTRVGGDVFRVAYRDPAGYNVWLPRTGLVSDLVPFADLDLEAAWRRHRNEFGHWDTTGFRATVRAFVTDPDAVHIDHCVECMRPGRPDDMQEAPGGEGVACSLCFAGYTTCDRCDELSRGTTGTMTDDRVCARCLNRWYVWCGDCNVWYERGGADHPMHPGPHCTCESPALKFAIRNDGHDPLGNDEFTTIALPAGVISDEGMDEIAVHLRWHARRWVPDDDYELRDKWYHLARRLDEVGSTWQTKQGNFTKRLSRFAYKEFGLKLSPDVVSNVGNIANNHAAGAEYQVAVTRQLNLPPEDFANGDSCWWGSYAASRCALKSNGGFGLRTFYDVYGVVGVEGRAWVMPLRQFDGGGRNNPILVPTFETLEADAFVVFNGYGNLTNYTPARILAHMVGMTYRKVGFEAGGEGVMYINGECGYLVAPEEIATRYEDADLDLDIEAHSNLFDRETNERNISHVA
jgi:hypothetical protein